MKKLAPLLLTLLPFGLIALAVWFFFFRGGKTANPFSGVAGGAAAGGSGGAGSPAKSGGNSFLSRVFGGGGGGGNSGGGVKLSADLTQPLNALFGGVVSGIGSLFGGSGKSTTVGGVDTSGNNYTGTNYGGIFTPTYGGYSRPAGDIFATPDFGGYGSANGGGYQTGIPSLNSSLFDSTFSPATGNSYSAPVDNWGGGSFSGSGYSNPSLDSGIDWGSSFQADNSFSGYQSADYSGTSDYGSGDGGWW